MRKEAALVFAVLTAMLVAASGLAQDEPEEEFLSEEIVAEESAGVTPDSPLYVFDKIVDNVQLSLAKGENKAKKALEIKEERIAEAAVMVEKKKPEAAIGALELAKKASEKAQNDLAPDLEKETNENVRRAATLLSGLKEKLPEQGWEGVEKAISAQLNEEEKVRVALLVSKSRLSYCDSLAKQDFDLMKGDQLCQLEKAPQWLREKVEGEFKSREENARGLILDTVGTCIVDPKKCDCSQIPVGKHSQSCEVKKALAIRCEYENDESACSELASEKLEDFLPDFIGEDGKQTLLSRLREKEQQMFEQFKPPECAAVSDFRECFSIMKELYGAPPECQGLGDDECIELMKGRPPGEHKENFPPECREAGVTTPLECAELMFSKYGKPPQCEGLDTRECMKLMRHERPDAANFGLPPECEQAGAKEPRQCFDIMTAKFGTPPECAGLDSDACFAEMMKRGPGGPREPMIPGGMPPECAEQSLGPKECALLMIQTKGTPPQCQELSAEECAEKLVQFRSEGPQCPPGAEPEECRKNFRDAHELPPECAENPERCRAAFAQKGIPGGLPTECAGLEKGQCELVMMKKFGPPECQSVSTKEECEAIMKEKYGSQGPGPGSEPRGEFQEGGFRGFEGGRHGFNECEGLSREECDNKMSEKYAPPECHGLSSQDCGRQMRERFEREGREHDQNRMDCEGLSEEECRQKPGERFKEPQFERRFEGGGGGAPGRIIGECEGLSPDKCAEKMRDFNRQRGEEREQRGVPPECQGLSSEECRSRFFEGKGEGEIRGEGEHREGDRPGQQRVERAPLGEPSSSRQQPYPSQHTQPPSSSGGSSGSESPTGDTGGSRDGGGGGSDSGEPAPSGITGQIVRMVKWVGGK